ncbi:MAG: hypothetical protein MJZ12_00185 [Prevotella sp.]|nr:hypothetical protein [Prevotella sp.]
MVALKEILERAMAEKRNDPFRRVLKNDEWDMDSMLELVRIYGKSVCPGFMIDENNRGLYEQLIYWTMGSPLMRAIDPITKEPVPGDMTKGIYIGGQTGRGKTVALKVLKRLYAINPLINYDKFGNIRLVGNWVERRADDITDIFSKEGDIHELKTEPVLCLQDFGSEPKESLYMGNRVDVMRSLIEYRGDMRGLTFISSNIPMGHEYLRNRYGDRVQSRLFAMCNYLELGGDDRRK